MSKKLKELSIYGGTSLGWLEDAEEVEKEITMATIKENNEVMQEMKQNLAQKINNDIIALLEKYKEPCLVLKMSIDINASVNIVHYSGNGRRSNPPMTVAETNANYSTHGIINWND